jgi:hypothetical protein
MSWIYLVALVIIDVLICFKVKSSTGCKNWSEKSDEVVLIPLRRIRRPTSWVDVGSACDEAKLNVIGYDCCFVQLANKFPFETTFPKVN